MTTLGWTCHTRAAPSSDMFNLGSSYFHVALTTVRHLLNSSLFRCDENLMIGPSLFSFWAVCDFAVRHSMRVVLFSLLSSIKFVVKYCCWQILLCVEVSALLLRGSVVVVVRKDKNVVVTNTLNYSAAALFHLFHHFYQLYHFKPRRRSNQLRARNSQRRTFRVVVGAEIEMSMGWGVGTGCPLSRWGEVRGGCHAHLIFRFQKDGFWWNLSGLIDLLLVSDKSG